jgi:hypothetical protein
MLEMRNLPFPSPFPILGIPGNEKKLIPDSRELKNRPGMKTLIPMSKVLTIITDNGSNMLKAVKTLKTNLQKANERNSTTCSDRDNSQTTTTDSQTEPEPDALTDSDGDNDDSTLSNTEEQDETDQLQITTGDDDHNDDDDMCLPDSLIMNRMPCLAHILQLVIKALEKKHSIENVTAKARKLVRMNKISSKANELLISKCGVTLVTECTTRWNSRFMMMDRLLKVKAALKEVLDELKLDCPLMHSDWSLIEQIVCILRSFKEQTDILQSNTMSMSQIIPSLLELKLFLKDPKLPKSMAQVLSQSLALRFSCFLDPDSPNFNPIPSVACLLDPIIQTLDCGWYEMTQLDC